MGDKTQIMAMTFATQYSILEVLFGVGLGIICNHGLAIWLGQYINAIVSLNKIQIIAALAFIFFGLSSLKEEDDDTKEKYRDFNPILTVAIAFFLGELGDKSQLTAMTLSASSNNPLIILMGTSLAMVLTSGLGIYIGSKIGKKIPELYIKITSSVIFLIFGSLKLYEWMPTDYINTLSIVIYIMIISLLEIKLALKLIAGTRNKTTKMQEAADKLYRQTIILSNAIDEICLGSSNCGACDGDTCIIGHTKNILKNARNNQKYYYNKSYKDINFNKDKEFDREKILRALSLILIDYIDNGFVEDDSFVVNIVKSYLEELLFKEVININDLELYLSYIGKINKKDMILLSNIIKNGG